MIYNPFDKETFIYAAVIRIQRFWRKKVIQANFYRFEFIEHFTHNEKLQGPE